ncbi:MAG: flagellar export protein FliJ [Desulfobulbaceae bacterium]|nr:flagellar export protein FliJ [Desulfobulbaceae bacterium]
MAFHFKLEPVLTVRRNIEEQVQLELAREQMVLNNYQRRLADLNQKRLQLSRDMEMRKKKTMGASMYLFYMEGLRVLELQIHILQNGIESQKQVVEKVRSRLAEAMKERKVIDVLREKDLQDYLADMRRKEQNESDEQALLRYGRGVLF